VFSEHDNGILNTWLLFDNQLTCDIISNPAKVMNIRQVPGHMVLSTQAGSTTMNWMANIPGYSRPVWFHPQGIANILSLANVNFHVHKEDGSVWIFNLPEACII